MTERHTTSGLSVHQQIYNIDEYRHASERMDPRHCLITAG
jgi:hypothetical protein